RMLAVDVDQVFPQFAQLPQRDRQAVDEGAAAALAVDDAAQDQGVVGVEFLLAQPAVQRVGRIEHGRDIGARRVLAQRGGVGAGAQGQRERVDEYRLARARFAGEYREPGVELDFGLLDDDKIAYMQGTQHGLFDLVGGLRHVVPVQLAAQG